MSAVVNMCSYWLCSLLCLLKLISEVHFITILIKIKHEIILTQLFSNMFFNKGKCSCFKSRIDLIPCFRTIANRYNVSFLPSHFKSGKSTKPVSGSES